MNVTLFTIGLGSACICTHIHTLRDIAELASLSCCIACNSSYLDGAAPRLFMAAQSRADAAAQQHCMLPVDTSWCCDHAELMPKHHLSISKHTRFLRFSIRSLHGSCVKEPLAAA